MDGITIAIATFNRCQELRRTLMTLTRLEATCDYEIVVIANRCTDQTIDVVRDMQPVFNGRLRCIEESRQGLSHARNRAVSEARFEIVGYLDDDVDVDPLWLKALALAHQADHFAAVGGRAHLVYPGTRPSWLGDLDEGLLTKVELGNQRRRAGADELYGVNLSFRKEWIRKVGGFRPDLGRVGTNLIGDEEAELLERIVRAGGSLLYEPAAVVGHRVPSSRLYRSWFWRRCFDGHRGAARALCPESITAKANARALWRLVRAAVGACGSLLMSGPTSQECFHQSTVVASRAGACVGLVGRVVASRGSTPQVAPAG